MIELGVLGYRTRPARASLAALGVAIGMAAITAVLCISTSSAHDLFARLDEMSNLLTVTTNPGVGGAGSMLPKDATIMIRRIDPVAAVGGIRYLPVTVRRTDHIAPYNTLGLTAYAADTSLLDPLHGHLTAGVFLNAATASFPAVVLGQVAAKRLGIGRLGVRVYVGDHWFAVVGIMDASAAAPELDRAALVGYAVAQSLWGYDAAPSTIYVRTDITQVDSVRSVLGSTAYPAHPERVVVRSPADALAARAVAQVALQRLLLGLGAVALLIGGIGVANVMVIAVMERRAEIGVRRALGASMTDIRLQFIAEACVLALVGGIAGTGIGGAVAFVYTKLNEMPAFIPVEGLIAAFAMTVVVGLLSGIYPAARAARMMPAEALRTH